ncbi:prepilin peptidase [Bacillus testis]|uniref:prepilin peptidase n=1 Tax=Bacillus testis TaxID=1622072 RepID=UPI00067E9335|nr:A24 family peptidase [Bacillus testis]
MILLISLYLFTLGLVLGSFYNVVGLRVPMKQSIVKPRSSCPKCKHVLSAGELVPVGSYIIQKGKCRSCKAPISPLYPLMELLTGVLFAISPLLIGWSSELLFAYALISLLVIVTVSDLAYMLIPDKILIVFAGIFLVLMLFLDSLNPIDSLLGAIVGFALLLLIALVSKGGMGGGDIKLFAVLGLALGVKLTLLALFFSVFYGAVIGIILMAAGVVKKKQPVPFGPFIALGALTSYYFGASIVQWYFGVLL